MGYLKSFKSVLLNEAEIRVNPLNGNLQDTDLVEIGEGPHKLNPMAAADYKRMKAAANAAGFDWGITDSYRRYEIQNNIFDWEKFRATGKRRKKGTDIAAAYPGTSNHGYGSAVDLIIKPSDPAYKWLIDNASRFGFYPLKGEPWHWDHKASAAAFDRGEKIKVEDRALSISNIVRKKDRGLAEKLEHFEKGGFIINHQAKGAEDVILFFKSYLPEEYKKLLGELEIKSPLYSKEFTQAISKFQKDRGLPRIDGAFDISTYNELFKDIRAREGWDAILIGGRDDRTDEKGKLVDYPIKKQLELFKKGYGKDKNVKTFRYNSPNSEILEFLKKNPKIPVFMFSAGAGKVMELLGSEYADPAKLFIIEPWAVEASSRNFFINAVNKGVKSENVFVGDTPARGKGIVPTEQSSGVENHWEALEKIGKLKSSVV